MNPSTVKAEFLQKSSPSEAPFLLTKKDEKPSKNVKTGHWSDKENTKYYAFLKQFPDKFSQKGLRREWKVFKALSEFVKTRNSNQCRSHHHKMQRDFQTIAETLAYLQIRIPGI